MKIKKYIQVAIVMVAGSIIFTMTGCNKTDVPAEEPVAIEQVQEIVEEDNDVAEVDLIENADDIGNGTEAEQTETYKVEFKYARNDEITAKVEEKVTVPEYEDTVLMDTYYGEEYFSIESDSYYAENFETISAEEHEDGSATIIAKGTTTEATYGMVTRYSYDEENMKAIFCYEPYGVDVEAEDFGLNFVIEKDTEGNYKIVGLQDYAGNDCSDIIFYYGDVIGWSLTENASEIDFDFGDEIYLSQDLVLYPVVKDMVDPAMESIDTSSGLWIKSFAGKAVQYSKTGKGSQSENGWYSKGGKVVSEDGKKEYNPETGKVEDTKPSDSDPSNPKNPKNPSNPSNPKNPSTPTTPNTPSTPSTPTTPGNSEPNPEANNPDPWGVPDVGGNMGTGDYTGMPVW